MATLQTIGFALGASFASGLNLYATIAALGLLSRFGVVSLPPSLAVLAHPAVLALALALYLVEFVADKVPYVDHVWDLIHTFVRPPAAGVLAYAAVVDLPEPWRVAAALLAGGVALTSHGTKASARAAVNASPEPISTWAVSLFEDGLAIGLAWVAAVYPLAALGIVTVLLGVSVWILFTLFRFLRRSIRRGFRGAGQA